MRDILLIEDDLMIGRSIVRILVDAGMQVGWVRDAKSGAASLAAEKHACGLVTLAATSLAAGGVSG